MDYKNFDFRMIDVGLDLRDTNDRVNEGKWVRLDNVRSTQEAKIQTKETSILEFTVPSTGNINSIRRVGPTMFIGTEDGSLFRDNTLHSTGWSGNPLSIVPYRQEKSPDIWGFVGDSAKMRVVKGDGTDYKWGVDAPVNAAVANASAAAGLLDSTLGVQYKWKYTYYSSVTGAESNGSPDPTAITVSNKKGEVAVQASTDPQVNSIRLYRSGGNLSGYHLSLTASNTTAVLTDNNSDLTLSTNEELRTDNYVPFSSVDANGNSLFGVPVPRVFGPFLGRVIFGVGDPNRKGAVYYTNELSPHGAGLENFTDVTGPQEPLQNGFMYGGIPYVASAENIYGLRYGSTVATSYSPFLTPVGKGFFGKYSFCVGPYVYFLGKDGIYQTDCQSPAVSITEDSLRPLFNGTSIGTTSSDYQRVDYFYATESFRMAFYGQNLHVFFRQVGVGSHPAVVFKHFIYNTVYKRWKFNGNETLGYGDEVPASTKFYSPIGKNALYVDPTGTPTASVHVRTGSLDLGMPQTLKEFGNLIIEADPSSSQAGIYITPYINGEATALPQIVCTGSSRGKYSFSLGDIYAYSIAFDFVWQGDASIYQITIQYRPDEESIDHWEFPETTHGISGMQQVKDVLLCLRSVEESTLSVTSVALDGTATLKTYLVPSTGGEKQKLLISLEATKGVLYRYQLDSDSPFRLYGGDCEIRVKPWKTSEGYQLVTPFA